MSNLPKEVEDFENAFLNVPGVILADIGHCNHSSSNVEWFKEQFYPAEFADLPIAMLNRTMGNLENEVLVYIDFQISPDQRGLAGLEYLSWWVRDLSRAGKNLQIRTVGLPPIIDGEIQLGKTLRFFFEAYLLCESDSMEPVFSQLEELTKSLESNLEDYKDAFIENEN